MSRLSMPAIVLSYATPGRKYDRVCCVRMHYEHEREEYVITAEGNRFGSGASGIARHSAASYTRALAVVERIVSRAIDDFGFIPTIAPSVLADRELYPEKLLRRNTPLRVDLSRTSPAGTETLVAQVERARDGEGFAMASYGALPGREPVLLLTSCSMDVASAALLVSVEARCKITMGYNLLARPLPLAIPENPLPTRVYEEALQKRAGAPSRSAKPRAHRTLAAATEARWTW